MSRKPIGTTFSAQMPFFILAGLEKLAGKKGIPTTEYVRGVLSDHVKEPDQTGQRSSRDSLEAALAHQQEATNKVIDTLTRIQHQLDAFDLMIHEGEQPSNPLT